MRRVREGHGFKLGDVASVWIEWIGENKCRVLIKGSGLDITALPPMVKS